MLNLSDYGLEDYNNIPNKDKRVVMLNSGGLDSCVLAHLLDYMGYEVVHLYIHYGNKTSKRDLECAENIVNMYGGKLKEAFIELPWLESTALFDKKQQGDDNFVVPMRNSIFLSLAWSLAESLGYPYVSAALDGSINLVTGETLEEVPDAHITFARKITEGFNSGSFSNIRLLTPFIGLGKANIISIGSKLGTDFTLARSCYNDEKEPCGVCGACLLRKMGFEVAGVKDPLIKLTK